MRRSLKLQKNTKNTLLKFKIVWVINVGTPGKLVTSACYDSSKCVFMYGRLFLR